MVITQLLLGDTIISSKTGPSNNSKKEKKSCGKVRNNKTMLKILSFIHILCLNIQQFFCSLRFEKSFFIAVSFPALYFTVR